MKNKLKKIKLKANYLFLLATCMFKSSIVFAGGTTPTPTPATSDLAQSKGVTGSIKLFTDLSAALLLVVPPFTIALVVWNLIQRQGAAEGEETKYTKRIKTIIITGIVAFLTSALVTIVLSYYQ